VPQTIEQVRLGIREVLARTGLSRRQLSLAMGRDPGYVAALLDESRPSRAIPTPADLERLSKKTGLALVYLLEQVWGIPPHQLADELSHFSIKDREDSRLSDLTDAELDRVLDFVGYVIQSRNSAISERPPS